MPQIFKPYSNSMDDKRRKINPDTYPEIIATYKQLKSTRKTAALFNCSRRLITFIVHPERLQELQRRNKEQQHWKIYYNREQLTKCALALRKCKRLQGLAFNPNTGKPSQAKHKCLFSNIPTRPANSK